MAKFKIGDKVRSKDYPDAGVMTITQIGQDVHGTTYRTKWENGSVPSQVFYDSTLVGANSAPVSTNAVVANALTWMDARSGKVATNTIGDCFADAVFHIERAARLVGQKPNSVKSELERAKQLIVGPYGAIKYDPDDRSLKATATRCATAIDKAIADPNVETITAARWACERARATADGGSPRRTFWSNSATNATAMNAAYSKALKAIMDSVKPLLDKRIKGDMSWNGPLQVITALRKTCDSATMSTGRYDHQKPRHRVYDVECMRDGLKFHGDLICTGLLHRDDPDDVSTFDEYDMTLALAYAGRALNASRSDAVLADYKKFVKAQMSAVLLALEKAKRDISAQGETSAKTAKATSSTDEHEIIRDYSGKTATAIDEAISKLKSAKENPLIL